MRKGRETKRTDDRDKEGKKKAGEENETPQEALTVVATK